MLPKSLFQIKSQFYETKKDSNLLSFFVSSTKFTESYKVGIE